MKFISIISILSAASLAYGTVAPPPVQDQTGAAPVAQQPAPGAAAAPPGQMTPEQVLMTCSIPHQFTPEEIKSMNQVFGIAIILLQYQLFINQDKSKEQQTYNELLKLWRTLMEMFKNVK